MPGCCVTITENMPPICENWDAGERRNFLAAVVSGSLVGDASGGPVCVCATFPGRFREFFMIILRCFDEF